MDLVNLSHGQMMTMTFELMFRSIRLHITLTLGLRIFKRFKTVSLEWHSDWNPLLDGNKACREFVSMAIRPLCYGRECVQYIKQEKIELFLEEPNVKCD
ncbi:hypothetical protein TNIN_103301 [Trichonephila inaurata madagascariensis]|uniref:Uncharacterized protein n=1 Tax=Trichonephila inaurata madagascariensis TaxID=2747483 RepID=A0A8X6M687_9ARAC|nr:hypothetical protein TNIN_103301 [Trichonephila inaurata madagascariensis]